MQNKIKGLIKKIKNVQYQQYKKWLKLLLGRDDVFWDGSSISNHLVANLLEFF